MGGSALAGDIFAAAAGYDCRVPTVGHRDFGLPLWVGAADLVIAVSASGATAETVSALEEAVRRGCRLLVVGAADSPLEALARRGRAVFVPVPATRAGPAALWSLAVPLLIAGDALGLLRAPEQVLAQTADRLETLAARCRPDADTVTNPAKTMAAALVGTLPVVWGTSPVAGAAAALFAGQLHAIASAPALWGVLPDAGHHQVAALDRLYVGAPPRTAPVLADAVLAHDGPDDFFRDRLDDPDPAGRTPLHLVLLRDSVEHPVVAERARICADLARRGGIEVSEVLAEGSSPVERTASLVGLADWASVYLALAEGREPGTAGIEMLRQRITG